MVISKPELGGLSFDMDQAVLARDRKFDRVIAVRRLERDGG
jgi:hypothetical protein